MSEETIVRIVTIICDCVFWTAVWCAFWMAVGGGFTKVIAKNGDKK